MKTIGLVGKSGTGKSHHALQIAKDYDCDAMIDDGLYIKDGRKIAGRSAKAEKTTIGAVKRAIFHDAQHAESVRQALQQEPCKKLLILGTSKGMVKQIAANLQLPEVEQWIGIEDVITRKEILTAMRVRKEEGRHVVPLPAPEIKEDFKGYLLDVIKPLFRKKKYRQDNKTIVRPVFSKLGNFTIHRQVIEQMVRYLAENTEAILQVKSIQLEQPGGRKVLKITIRPNMVPSKPMIPEFKRFQQQIVDEISFYLGINIDEVQLELI